jgi:hypothetical protein
MGEGLVAPDPSGKAAGSDEAERDGSNGRRKHCVRNADGGLRDGDRQERGQERHGESADRNDRRSSHDQAPLPVRPVNKCADGGTGHDSRDPGDHHDNADLAGVPMLACQQIDGEKRTQPILDVGEEEIEPVERSAVVHPDPRIS